MYFKSFFKLIISSFVKQVTFISLVFVFSFFWLAYFYCLILLFSIALIYPTLFTFACTSVQLSCLRFPEHTKASFFPKYPFLRVFILIVLQCSSKKYFNSSSDISGHSLLVTNRLVFFLHDFIRCCLDPHA